MSAKSKKSAKGSKYLRRPFAPAVLAEARKLVGQYQVVLSCEDGHWYGRGLELSNVLGDGKTADAAVVDTRKALVAVVATMIEEGERPPAPAQSGRRTEQVNVRLSADEKLLLETVAKRKGYSGMSDFIRAVAVEAAR